MNVTITGGTGFIGRHLIYDLVNDRHQVHVLARQTNVDLGSNVWISLWDAGTGEPPPDSLKNADAIVHLAGEPIAQRWTVEAKKRIRDSRIHGTRHLIHALSTLSRRPAVLVCASAIGYYGSRGDKVLTESSSPGAGFLPELCVEWEKQAELAESLGIRVVRIRTGVVLAKEGGALPKMLPAFKAFAGGKIGSGKQWMSWMHIADVVGLIRYAIEHPLQGPVNGVAPNPVTNAEFTRHLAATLHRPALFPVPGLALKALFGEMSEVLLGGQRVSPKAALEGGYQFRFNDVVPALKQILG